MSKKNIALLTVILAILIDQIVKIYIKTNFYLQEEVIIFDWFRIHFVENNGMAMGFEFGGKAGKLFLTLFRLVAVSGIIYWLVQAEWGCPQCSTQTHGQLRNGLTFMG